MPNKEEVAAMDRLIMEVASPRTRRTLNDYKQQSKVSSNPASDVGQCLRHNVWQSMGRGLSQQRSVHTNTYTANR